MLQVFTPPIDREPIYLLTDTVYACIVVSKRSTYRGGVYDSLVHRMLFGGHKVPLTTFSFVVALMEQAQRHILDERLSKTFIYTAIKNMGLCPY